MYQHDRLNAIRSHLLKDGQVMINDITKRFSVSKVTARKDLDMLVRDGVANKIRGGAVCQDKPERPISGDLSDTVFKSHPEYALRKRIALQAVKNVSDGNTIFLGSGMTCCILAKLLAPIKDLTVVTNNLTALPDLLAASKKVMIIGGEITTVDGTTYFSWAEDVSQFLKNVYVHKVFTSCTGFDLHAGITVDSIVSTYVYRCIPAIKKEWFMLVDHVKFNKIGLYPLDSIDATDCIITDEIPDETRQFLSEKDIAIQFA